MADEFVIRLIPEGMGSGSSGGNKGGGGLNLGGLGKLGAIIGLICLAMEPLKPMLTALKQLGKMVAEFLRPIAEVVTILLQPVLAMLRPILIAFKALMAPFKQAAMAGIAASNQLIAQGMALGADTEEGSGLIGEGLSGAMQSASLLFSGFIETIFAPLANLLGLGDQWSNAMDKWQDSALEGVHRVIILSDTVGELTNEFGDLREGVAGALAVIDEQIAILREEVGTFTIENFQRDLETAQTIVDATAALAVGDFETARTAVENLNTPFEQFAGYMNDLYDILPGANDAMREYAQNMTNAAKAQFLMGVEASNLADEPSWWEKFKGGWKELTSAQDSFWEAINPVDMIKDFSSGWTGVEKAWKIDSENTMNEMKALIGAGFGDMKTTTDDYMGHSYIPESYNKGLTKMHDSTETFTNSLGNFTDRTKKYADRIDSYLDSAKSSAEAAAKYAKKAKASASAAESVI